MEHRSAHALCGMHGRTPEAAGYARAVVWREISEVAAEARNRELYERGERTVCGDAEFSEVILCFSNGGGGLGWGRKSQTSPRMWLVLPWPASRPGPPALPASRRSQPQGFGDFLATGLPREGRSLSRAQGRPWLQTVVADWAECWVRARLALLLCPRPGPPDSTQELWSVSVIRIVVI